MGYVKIYQESQRVHSYDDEGEGGDCQVSRARKARAMMEGEGTEAYRKKGEVW